MNADDIGLRGIATIDWSNAIRDYKIMYVVRNADRQLVAAEKVPNLTLPNKVDIFNKYKFKLSDYQIYCERADLLVTRFDWESLKWMVTLTPLVGPEEVRMKMLLGVIGDE